jgi:hypothetical protein
MTSDSVELALSKMGVWETEVEEPEVKQFKMMIRRNKKDYSSDESSSDDDDREYVSNQIKSKRY